MPREPQDRVVAEAHIPTNASEDDIVERLENVREPNAPMMLPGASLVASVLLFVALWIAGLIWSGSGEFFGVANSFYFALAYLVARAGAVLLRDLVYDGTGRTGAGGPPRTTT
jgi:hypothetical protein